MFCLTELCHICVNYNVNSNYIEEDDLNILKYCVPEGIFDNDFPLSICDKCCDELNRFYAFKIMCVRNNKNINSYLTKLQSTKHCTNNKFGKLNVSLHRITKNNSSSKPEENIESEPVLNFELIENCDSNDTNAKACEAWLDTILSSQQDITLNTGIKLEGDDNFREFDYENDRFHDLNSTMKNEENIKEERLDLLFEDTDISEEKESQQTAFKCKQCGKCFTRKFTLKIHNRVHTGERPYSCNICGKFFKQLANVKAHKSNVHNNEKKYPCPKCGKRFKTKTYLTTHMYTHSQKRYKCPKCDKYFKQKSKVKSHYELVHIAIMKYQCNICQKKFKMLINLKLHLRRHTGEKPYKCDTCEKAFTNASDLQKHVVIHTNERKYKCHLCRRAFSRGTRYRQHLQMHELSYKCLKCPKEFKSAIQLKRHGIFHGEKFECDLCHQLFSREWSVRVHKLKMH